MAGTEAAPPPRLDFKEPGSFPHRTLLERMPVILDQAIADVRDAIAKATPKGEPSEADRACLDDLAALRGDMAGPGCIAVVADGGEDCAQWNAYLGAELAAQPVAPGDKAATTGDGLPWLEASWLFAECYMYRRIQSALRMSSTVTGHDPFRWKKQESYHASEVAVAGLADHVLHLDTADGGAGAQLQTMLQFSLWGNKCDLSLMASYSGGKDSLSHMQEGTAAGLSALEPFIVVNDFGRVAARVAGLTAGARVDIVLDNAGFELFTDLCLAHWLVSSSQAGEVVLHTKKLPWFVSDASNEDVRWVVAAMTASANASVARLGAIFEGHLRDGRWRLKEDVFWTLPHDFSAMEAVAPALHADLAKAALVVFKGDLNYRKLLGDRTWEPTASFGVATRGFRPTALCALRTNKSDGIVGLEPGQAEQLSAQDSQWRFQGKYGVIQLLEPASS